MDFWAISGYHMKPDISNVKNFNLLFIVLIVAQLILMVMTLIMIATHSTNGVLPTSSIITAILLILFCIPICIVLYRSNIDRISKRIVQALLYNFLALATSGIFLYFFDIGVFGDLAIVISYLPLTYALIITYNEQKYAFTNNVKWFIFSLSAIFILFLSYFVLSIAIKKKRF